MKKTLILLCGLLVVVLFSGCFPRRTTNNQRTSESTQNETSPLEVITEIEYPETTDSPSEEELITVTVIDKINFSADASEWRFSPRVEFVFEISNNGERDIKGIQGVLEIQDMFEERIMQLNVRFTQSPIPANSTITHDGIGIDINQFMDRDIRLYNSDFDTLIFIYTIDQIIYDD